MGVFANTAQIDHDHIRLLFDRHLQPGHRVSCQEYEITASRQRPADQFEVFDVIIND
jgi:hypothetical protein